MARTLVTIIRFYVTRLNILFTTVRKVWHFLHEISKCSTELYRNFLHRISPKSEDKRGRYGDKFIVALK
jgi:hypothetical protein